MKQKVLTLSQILKLASMMFLYYFSMGLITPILTVYLTSNSYLGLSGPQAGFITSLQSIAVVVSPIIGTFLTDRLISAHKLFALLQFLAGLLLFYFPFIKDFHSALFAFALYEILFVPGTALSNAIAFHHLHTKADNFGVIRLWGTIGWIVAGIWGFIIGHFFASYNLHHTFVVCGICSIILAIFSYLFLGTYNEDSSRENQDRGSGLSLLKKIIPTDTFKFVLQKEILLIFIISIFIKLIDKYYYFGCCAYLSFYQVKTSSITAIMSIGQISEIICFLFLAKAISRFGYKRILFVGILSEFCRFLLLAFVPSVVGVFMALPFHGISFVCFSGAAYIFINRGTTKSSRGGVQHLYALVTGVAGNFWGSLIPGLIVGSKPIEEFENYTLFWAVPMLLSLFSLALLFLLKAKEERQVV